MFALGKSNSSFGHLNTWLSLLQARGNQARSVKWSRGWGRPSEAKRPCVHRCFHLLSPQSGLQCALGLIVGASGPSLKPQLCIFPASPGHTRVRPPTCLHSSLAFSLLLPVRVCQGWDLWKLVQSVREAATATISPITSVCFHSSATALGTEHPSYTYTLCTPLIHLQNKAFIPILWIRKLTLREVK